MYSALSTIFNVKNIGFPKSLAFDKQISFNGSFPANLPHDMMSYIHKLHKQIKANWIPVTTEINDIRLSYTIDKDGKISNIDIGYSRGPEEAILAAKNAILAIKAPKFPDSSNLTELRLNHYFNVKENKIY